MENITYEMIPEFEFDAETTKKFCAYAYLNSMEDGMSEEDGFLIYGLTKAEADFYKEDLKQLKASKCDAPNN